MTYLQRKSVSIPSNIPPIGEVNGLPIYNCSYTGFPLTEMNYNNPNYERERDHALHFKTKDGIKPMTKEELEAERSVSRSLIKKMTMAIFKMDFSRFSFPVAYCEPRSFLERTADILTFLVDPFLDKAIKATTGDEKFIFVIAGIVAGFHLQMQSKKPWNPILGETYVGKWPNGSTIFSEQTSHHPPVSVSQMFGPQGEWKLFAQCHFGVSVGPIETQVLQSGLFHLELPGGYNYEWEFPNISAIGIIRGDRVVRMTNPFKINDLKEGKECKLKFGSKKNKKSGSGQTSFIGGIRQAGHKKYTRIFQGDYASDIYVDDEKIWDITTDLATRPAEKIPDDLILSSDSRFRIDRGILITETNDKADEAKILLENAQRKDQKLRSDTKKKEKK